MSGAAGTRRHRLRLERLVPQADAYGNPLTGGWSTLGTVWAAVDQKQKGRAEELAAGRLQSSLSWRITLQRSALTAGLTAADRGVFTAGPHTGVTVNFRVLEVSPDGSEIMFDVEAGVAA